MPLTLTPMLLTTPPSWSAGMALRIARSIWLQRRVVSLDPRAGLRPHVQLDLAAIDRWEKVAAEQGR